MKIKSFPAAAALAVAAFAVAALLGLMTAASADHDIRYLAFTADVHYNRNDGTGENPFRAWMEKLRNVVPHVEYMAFLGDNSSAYSSDTWGEVGALMELADSYKTSGFVLTDNLFLLGNHERWTTAGGNFDAIRDSVEHTRRFMQAGKYLETDGYALYSFGADKTPEGAPYYGANYGGGGAQMFTEENIEALDKYLKTVSADIPVFIMSHYPIHTFTSPEGVDRESGNAEMLIDALNKYPNVIFLWGHNHSSADPLYDTFFHPGEMLHVGPLAENQMKEIKFYYASAGCMHDAEYRAARSTSIPGGANVKGKGLLAVIDGATITLTYYGIDGNVVNTDIFTIGGYSQTASGFDMRMAVIIIVTILLVIAAALYVARRGKFKAD